MKSGDQQISCKQCRLGRQGALVVHWTFKYASKSLPGDLFLQRQLAWMTRSRFLMFRKATAKCLGAMAKIWHRHWPVPC